MHTFSLYCRLQTYYIVQRSVLRHVLTLSKDYTISWGCFCVQNTTAQFERVSFVYLIYLLVGKNPKARIITLFERATQYQLFFLRARLVQNHHTSKYNGQNY